MTATTFDLEGFTLRAFYDKSLDKYGDCTSPPFVTIEIKIKSQEGQNGEDLELSIRCTGSLEEADVGALIAALNEALELSRTAAKKRGYYDYRAAVEKEGTDEMGWPPSWNVGNEPAAS